MQKGFTWGHWNIKTRKEACPRHVSFKRNGFQILSAPENEFAPRCSCSNPWSRHLTLPDWTFANSTKKGAYDENKWHDQSPCLQSVDKILLEPCSELLNGSKWFVRISTCMPLLKQTVGLTKLLKFLEQLQEVLVEEVFSLPHQTFKDHFGSKGQIVTFVRKMCLMCSSQLDIENKWWVRPRFGSSSP